MLIVLFLLSLLTVGDTQHIVASWEFSSLDGWAASTFEEIGAEIYIDGSELRGKTRTKGILF